MLESGEDLALCRAPRRCAWRSEDIGLARPGALAVTLAAKDAFDFLGPPEGFLALGQAAVYFVACAKIECALHGVRRGGAGFAGNHRGACSASSKKCADRIDGEISDTAKTISMLTTQRGKSDGHDVPAGESDWTPLIIIRQTRDSNRAWRQRLEETFGGYRRSRARVRAVEGQKKSVPIVRCFHARQSPTGITPHDACQPAFASRPGKTSPHNRGGLPGFRRRAGQQDRIRRPAH